MTELVGSHLASQKFSWFRRNYNRWINNRTPVAEQVSLSQRNVYIFPSLPGLSFLVLIGLLWLMATNYENNLIFSLCFLLLALFIAAIHFSHANLWGLTIRVIRATSVFAGQTAAVELCLSQKSGRFRDSIELCFDKGEPLTVSLSSRGDTFVTLLLPTYRRGFLNTGRLTITSYYPLGLLRVWAYARFRPDAVVYPHPQEAPFTGSGTSTRSEGHFRGDSGSDDYVGLRQYRVGEPLRHIAWKHYAREQGLWSKQYADPVEQNNWVDWDCFAGMNREQRLSRMCWQVCELAGQGAVFGMRLPGIEFRPNTGQEQRDKLLRALAVFEVSDHPESGLS